MSDEKVGKTGRFPEGRLNDFDEGEIQFRIAADPTKGIVILDFGSPVKWLGLPLVQARELGLLLIQESKKLEN